MRIFLLLISIFASCDHPKKPYIEELTWPIRTVKLDNDLGVLTIRLPEEFDTFLRWHHVSDCRCCGSQKYRIQNSQFPVAMENGFFYKNYPDSSYSLTISHSEHEDC